MQKEKNKEKSRFEKLSNEDKEKKRGKKLSKEAIERICKHRKYQLGMILFGALLICTLLFISNYYARQKRAERMYEDLRMEQIPSLWMRTDLIQVPEEKAESTLDPSLRREKVIDFQKLWELNTDIYAWIEIPGTLVDYPVLQHPSDDAYYLNHTAECVEGLPGSIYSELIHSKDFSAVHTILYGHNMKDDSMFGSLHDYEEAEKLTESPYIYIYLPESTLVYEIFAAVRFSDAYLPVYYNYEKEEDFTSFIAEVRQSTGNINPLVEVPFGSRILTLSTCIGNEADSRFLVTSVLIEEY